jgi:2-polyprenyl-3-methyl-5-hydroxy-6-metoxy-1,4-benzoquinol methylase
MLTAAAVALLRVGARQNRSELQNRTGQIDCATSSYPMSQHNNVVREQFTRQATSFAASPWISDERLIQNLVAAAHLNGSECVLDIACGPGYIAQAFAGVGREVVGVDLTAAMLTIARERTAKFGLKNISFRTGDVRNLAFADGKFDVVVCRYALHHVEQPGAILQEMARVCRDGGTVLIEDLFASEHPERAAYQNRFEILRDSAHVRALPLSELLQGFCAAGLEVDAVTMNERTPEIERWMATTKTTGEEAAEIRRLLAADLAQDLSGTHPFHDSEGHLRYHARTAILTGRKLSTAQTATRSKQST